MADAYSNWVSEENDGTFRSYIKAWIEAEDNTSATVYAWGCVDCSHLTNKGIRTKILINNQEVSTTTAVVQSAEGMVQVAETEGRMVIDKVETSQLITVSCIAMGEELEGSLPVQGSASASVSIEIAPTVFTSPAAPTDLRGTRDAAANIVLTWVNNSDNASSTLIERMEKGGKWSVVATIRQVLTTYTDSPGAGTFKYRVRYVNAHGYSGYSNESEYIETLCAPAPPTLTIPASGATVNAALKTTRVSWVHNTIDTSLQTAAEIAWAIDDSDYQTASVGANQYYDLPIEGNHAVYWRVRTKGAYAEFSPWSAVSSFLVRTAPVVTLNVPSTITNIPISVSWTYKDEMGTQISAVLKILNASNEVVHTITLGNVQAYTISGTEFTPLHGKTYTFQLTVTSSTSLSSTVKATVRADYVTPAKPDFALAVNKDEHAVKVTVFAGEKAEAFLETKSLSVFRDETLIASGLAPGQSAKDYLPPLDKQIVYRVVAYAKSGAANERKETLVVHSRGNVVFNFGEDYSEIAKLSLNFEESDETEGEKELYLIASSKYPKVFYGERSTRSGSISGDVLWSKDVLGNGKRSMLSAIEVLKEHNGLVYMRLPYRDAMHVDCNVQVKRTSDRYNIASVMVDWQAVSG